MLHFYPILLSHYRTLCIAIVITTIALTNPSVASASQPVRPNILFIVTDDQRPDTIAALGNKYISTPTLDHLVRTGLTFTHCHSPNPLCVPSRAEILTGRSGFRNGVLGRGRSKLRPNMTYLAQVLRAAGYHTWYVGKWHTAGRPSTLGYTDTLGLFSSGGGKYWKGQKDYKGMDVTGYRGWIFQTDKRKLFPKKGVGLQPNISADFADAAIQFIKRKPTRPFFLHVNFTAPHDPLLIPPGYQNKYDPKKIPLPPNYRPQHPFDHGNAKGRDEKMLPWPRTKAAVRRNLAAYYAVISHMDAQIGRILQALRDTGQMENTIILFTSDHGLAVGSHGLMGKQNMYAHTVQVPLLIAGPGIAKGQRRDALCYLRDLYPTFCDIAGAKIPTGVDAKSLWPVVRGQKKKVYDRVYGYFDGSQRMVRDHRWKLIHYPKAKRYQLFDVQNDPHELMDLSKRPQYQERVMKMRQELVGWQKRVGDPIFAQGR